MQAAVKQEINYKVILPLLYSSKNNHFLVCNPRHYKLRGFSAYLVRSLGIIRPAPKGVS